MLFVLIHLFLENQYHYYKVYASNNLCYSTYWVYLQCLALFRNFSLGRVHSSFVWYIPRQFIEFVATMNEIIFLLCLLIWLVLV